MGAEVRARRGAWLTTIGALVLLAPPSVHAQVHPGVDSVMAGMQRTDGPGCAVGLRHRGQVVHRKAYGMANLEYGVPFTADMISESGSVAKQFTAAAVVLLAQQGRLSLDDDIRRYLPEMADFGAPITIRQLLHHTSGLRDQWALLGLMQRGPGTEVHTVPEVYELLTRQRQLNFPSGSRFLYSNSGYTLAGMIVERVSGQTLPVFTTEQFFRPLGMRHTQWRDDYRRVVPTRVTAYAPSGQTWLQDMPFTHVIGNGGLLTTVDDLLTWNEALTEGRVAGGPELVKLLETGGRLSDGTVIAYALGLVNGRRGASRTISHTGATAGYRTVLLRVIEDQLSLALLCNAANLDGGIVERILGAVLGPAQPIAPPARAVAAAPALLDSIAGQYRDTVSDQVLTFFVREGALHMGSGANAPRLTPLEGMRFWHAGAGEFRFERAADGWRAHGSQDGARVLLAHRRLTEPTHPLATYTGIYASSELDFVWEIAEVEGRLEVRLRGERLVPLVPLYPDGFTSPGQTVRFLRNADGAVSGLRVYAGRALGVHFRKIR